MTKKFSFGMISVPTITAIVFLTAFAFAPSAHASAPPACTPGPTSPVAPITPKPLSGYLIRLHK